MKIKSLLTCMMVSLVTILPLQAQVGKEMKAFRNKDGITVTMLNPSLYSLYKQGDLSLPAEEALKDIKEINVMQVDIKRATPKVVEEPRSWKTRPNTRSCAATGELTAKNTST